MNYLVIAKISAGYDLAFITNAVDAVTNGDKEAYESAVAHQGGPKLKQVKEIAARHGAEYVVKI